jgi:hypothetical protein
VINVIDLVLSLLKVVLDSANTNNLAAEIVAGIEAAIAELQKVRGTDVTFAQLESLRVQPKW